jgi:hypothetical protein
MASLYDSGLLYDSGALYDDTSSPPTKRKRMAQVKLGLDAKNPEDKVAQALTIKTSMTGNANFTTPNPSLATYNTHITAAQTKIAAYNTAVAAAQTALADRDAAIATMDGDTTQLGSYVQNVANGDKTKIESAGMDTKADGAPITMTQVLDLALSEGDDEGTLDIVWKPVKGAKSYEIWLNTGDPGVPGDWSLKQTSGKSSDKLVGLAIGARYWAKVRAIGGGNQKGPYSDPATKTAP